MGAVAPEKFRSRFGCGHAPGRGLTLAREIQRRATRVVVSVGSDDYTRAMTDATKKDQRPRIRLTAKVKAAG
jgi:hypothetical protein